METHTATVFLTGDRAVKVKKPVRLAFLDFSSREQRLAACRAELELNRRLAPDVYLGVVDMVVDGRPVEHGLLMRRLPAERSLSALVVAGADHLVEALADVAGRLAAFHASCPAVGKELPFERTVPIETLWASNVDEMLRLGALALPARELAIAAVLAASYAWRHRQLFQDRLAAGLVRDGHGDLLADDVFLLDDGPRVLDCLEFDDRLRTVDVLLDVASLAMDLERLGRRDLAESFLGAYAAQSTESHPPTLAHFFIAYRALVRAKVAAIRAAQGNPGSADEAQGLLKLSLRHLRAARTRLIVVGGLPGSGKTTLAAAVAASLPAAHMSSDAIRWELTAAGDGAPAHVQSRYTKTVTDRVYTELIDRAEHALAAGNHVVLDASWAATEHRKAARDLARRTGADLIEVLVATDEATALNRLKARRTRPGESEADAEVRSRMQKRFKPWPEATRVESVGSGDEAVRSVLSLAETAEAELDGVA